MEFKTINYTRFECVKCLAVTVINPGEVFNGKFNCNCKEEKKAVIEKVVNVLKESVPGDVIPLPKEVSLQDVSKALEAMDNAEVSDKNRVILNAPTIEELRLKAKELKIKGYANMRYEKLVSRIQEKGE